MEFDFISAARGISASLVGGRGHYQSVVEAVMAAKSSVWIATANLKELLVEDARAHPGRRRTIARSGARSASYRSVLDVFAEMVGRGVEIRILHASPPSRPFAGELRKHGSLTRVGSGMSLRLCPRVHFKAVVIDGALVYLGSANWTGAGLGVRNEGRRNFELGFVSRDDLLLDQVQSYYDALWRGGGCQNCRMRDLCPRPLDLPLDQRVVPVAPARRTASISRAHRPTRAR